MVGDALEELDDKFFAHAWQGVELAGLGGGFEFVDVRDLEGRPDEGNGLGAHAGEAQEFEHRGAVFGEEFFAEGNRAGGDEIADVGGHAFADAVDGEQGFGVGVGRGEGGELRGLLFDGLGGAAVRADPEGIGAVDFEKCSGFVEEACEGDVVHRVMVRQGMPNRYSMTLKTGSSFESDKRLSCLAVLTIRN